MRFALLVEPQQGYTYRDIRRVALHAEAVGFETLFRSDHYQTIGSGPQEAATDAWTTIAALAVETTTIRLGTLVSPVTFRHPSVLAKMATTVDELSQGRIEVGLGAGWLDTEHHRFGLDMPNVGSRFDMLEDTLGILKTLWGPSGGDYVGHHWRVQDSAMFPPPVQRPHPPIILGGEAGRRASSLAARFADEYNVLGFAPDRLGERFDSLRAACVDLGRDPRSLTLSAMVPTIVGRSSREVRRRIRDALEEARSTLEPATVFHSQVPSWLVGDIESLAEDIRRYEMAGTQRLVFELLAGRDLGLIDAIAEGCSAFLGHPLRGSISRLGLS